jgi:hypothetical protein
MTLVDGLTFFADDEGPDWKRTLELEERGQEMVRLVEKFRDCPDAAAQQFAHRLLIDIEAWKGMCMRERMVNAVQNTPASVWAAFYGAVISKTDLTKIEAIMGLKGFGQSVDEETGMRRAKVASSVLRFLYPMEWGVVDWRTLAIRSALRGCNGDVDRSLEAARGDDATTMRALFDLIDKHVVCGEVRAYREMRAAAPLSRAADIDMALFGLSLSVWPLPNI